MCRKPSPCCLQLQPLNISWTTVTEPALAANPAADQLQTRQTLLSGYFFPTARLRCWFDRPIQPVSFAAIIHTEASVSSPHNLDTAARRFSVAALRLWNSLSLFHRTVELHHPLTHLRSMLRHFSLIRHNRTVARSSVLWRDINWLIDWLIVTTRKKVMSAKVVDATSSKNFLAYTAASQRHAGRWWLNNLWTWYGSAVDYYFTTVTFYH